MAATLTKAMLEDLHKGNASLSLLPYTEGGVSLAALDFTGADQIFTLRDSLQLTPSDADVTSIKIDQLDEIIDMDMNEGDYTIKGNIPSVASELLDYFYDKGNEVTGIKGQDGTTYTGQAYKQAKYSEVSILLESETKKTAIALARVKMCVNPPTQESIDTPAYISFTGYVLINPLGDKFAVVRAAE